MEKSRLDPGAEGSGEEKDQADDQRTATASGVMVRQAPVVGPGTVVATRYQIERPLGEGGSGTVYRAWDRLINDSVAIKVLHAERARDRSWIRRLTREVKIARAIRHPNVCRVFEIGHADGLWFLTMELGTGGSLRDLLARAGAGGAPPRPLAERLEDMRGLSAGLAALHALGITHRDVTPQNVLRMADGRLVLTDFGLAIERDAQTTVYGGTPAYLPPEAARGERSDQRSDVFQLGMIMHELLFDVRPAWTAAGTRLAIVELPPGRAAVEAELSLLIAGCLDPDPKRRPATAMVVAGGLAAAEAARPPSLPQRALRRLRWSARRHPLLLKAGAVALGLAALMRTVQVASRPPLCEGADRQLVGIWDAERAAGVRRAFTDTARSYAAESFARVATLFDDYAASWRRMYTDSCQATHVRGEQSAEVLDLRTLCLQQMRGELGALTALFSRADGETVARAVQAASGLSPVARCADVPTLRAVMRPPSDPATRDRVAALRQQVAEASALRAAGHYREARERGAGVVAEARTIGYDPLLAEALTALGAAKTWAGPTSEAEAALDQAMLLAEGSRHDRALAEAAVFKISMLAVADRGREALQFAPRAQAALRRVGGDARLESWVYAAQAFAYNREAKYVEALALQERALALKQSALGAQDPDVALSLGNIASYLQAMGRNQEALAANQRALGMLTATYGPSHPEVARHLANRGEIELALGHLAEAEQDFRRAIDLLQREPLADQAIVVSFAENGLGLTELAQGRPARALAPLEHALQRRAAAAATATERSETSFALARALWDGGGDHGRALALAESARDLLPPDRGQRKEIEQTLAAWRRRPPTPPK